MHVRGDVRKLVMDKIRLWDENSGFCRFQRNDEGVEGL